MAIEVDYDEDGIIIDSSQDDPFPLSWDDAFELMNKLVNELPNKAVEYKEKRRKLLLDDREKCLQDINKIDQKLKEL